MNTTKTAQEIQVNTERQAGEVGITERDVGTMNTVSTLGQRVAICFAAGVLGALAVLLFSQILFGAGLSQTLGVKAPVSLKSPDVYRPLFWGGLWGILFGLFVRPAWKRLYLVGFLYVLAPLTALFLFFPAENGCWIFWTQSWRADVYALPCIGESSFRDSHRLGCQGDNRQASLKCSGRGNDSEFGF